MEKLFDYLEKLERSKSIELLLTTDIEPRIKTLSGWMPLVDEKVSLGEIKQILQGLGFVEKVNSSGFEIQINASMYRRGLGEYLIKSEMVTQTPHAQIKKMNRQLPETSDLNLPQVVLDLTNRMKGLLIISGPQFSGKTTTLNALIRKIKQERSCVLQLFSEAKEYEVSPSKGIVIHRALKNLNPASLALGNVLLLDEELDECRVDLLKEALDQGQLVIITVSSLSSLSALEKIVMKGSDPEHTLKFFVHHLLGVINQRLLLGTNLDKVLASEVLVATPQVKNMLLQNQGAHVVEQMKTTGEKTGMRTLNQSLLQLLMRRKIEIKFAFENSLDPEELDQLLSKVGI